MKSFDTYSFMLNPFFKNVGPFYIEKLLSKTNIDNIENFKKDKIFKVLKNLKKSNDLKDTIEFIVNREK